MIPEEIKCPACEEKMFLAYVCQNECGPIMTGEQMDEYLKWYKKQFLDRVNGAANEPI